MTDQFLSVPTLIRGMFRAASGPDSPRLYGGALPSTTGSLREEILASSRVPDLTGRLLAEMDRKLDAVLALLQRDSLVKDFPGEGYVTELSASELVLESEARLSPGSYLELLLLLDEFPMRIVSVLTRVKSPLEGFARTGEARTAYAASITDVEAHDRETIIQFVFREERKRIRRQKDDE